MQGLTALEIITEPEPAASGPAPAAAPAAPKVIPSDVAAAIRTFGAGTQEAHRALREWRERQTAKRRSASAAGKAGAGR